MNLFLLSHEPICVDPFCMCTFCDMISDMCWRNWWNQEEEMYLESGFPLCFLMTFELFDVVLNVSESFGVAQVGIELPGSWNAALATKVKVMAATRHQVRYSLQATPTWWVSHVNSNSISLSILSRWSNRIWGSAHSSALHYYFVSKSFCFKTFEPYCTRYT